MKKIGILALVCALTLALAGCGGGNASVAAPTPDAEPETMSETVASAPEAVEDAALPPVAETMTAAEDIQSYLSFASYSRAELIELLVYDGFSEEDAAAAVDAAGIDWNEQAVLQAKLQMETLPNTTYDELVDQLEYAKFTHEQAVYGADNYNK